MVHIEKDIPLASFSTFRTGGRARFFATVHTMQDIQEARAFALREQVPLLILGGGSNVLFPDRGVDALVLQIAIRGVSYTDEGREVVVRAGAGEAWDAFVADTVARGLWGLENLSAIPGTVGGTPVQNVGAYGVEVKDLITSVETFDMKEGAVKIFLPDACAFAYRESIFKQNPHILIMSVSFRLQKEGVPMLGYRDLAEYFSGKNTHALTSRAVRDAVCEIRGKKFPSLAEMGTAGSFFKNPSLSKEDLARVETYFGVMPPAFLQEDGTYKVPLAWILDRLGLKGKRTGNVGTHGAQPIVLVNYGGATTDEILACANSIVAEVKEKVGITISFEVRLVSPHSFFFLS